MTGLLSRSAGEWELRLEDGALVCELRIAGALLKPGYYRLRPPIKPVTLAELAALPQTEASVTAVVR